MRRWPRPCLGLGVILLAACGGHTAREQAPGRAHTTPATETSDAPSASEEEGATRPSAADICTDDTCFRCGNGFCMAGFFCDEDAAGGAACSWLPSCPARPGCDCVERVLGAACRCEDGGGKVTVSCG